MKDLLESVLPLAGVAGFLYVYLKLVVLIDERSERKFGRSVIGRKLPKVEFQSLFHGNTKDQDQL